MILETGKVLPGSQMSKVIPVLEASHDGSLSLTAYAWVPCWLIASLVR